MREKKQNKKQKLTIISCFYSIKKFINVLKRIAVFRTPKFLAQKKENFKIINDLTYFFKRDKQNGNKYEISWCKTEQNQTKILEKFSKISMNLLKKFPIFDSSSPFVILWNVINMFLILGFLFSIPLEGIGINLSEENENCYFIYCFGASIFFLDILVNFNTVVFLQGKLLKKRTKIFKNYIRTYLFRDLLSAIAIFLQIPFYNKEENAKYIATNAYFMTLIRMLFFLRMFNFSSIIKKFEGIFFISQTTYHIVSLMKLIFRITLLSHILACVWLFVGTIHLNNSWLSHLDLINEPWWIKYLNSFYYVCTTMNTKGYGDITPQNSLEKLFTIVLTYISCGIFAYCMKCIGMIISDHSKRYNECQKDMHVINEFMMHKKIDFKLTMRVRKYIEYIWNEEKIERLEKESKIINKLSDSLKEELLLKTVNSIMHDFKMFSLNFSEEFLSEITPLINEVRFAPGDSIFMKGDLADKSLYIIKAGKVEIFLKNSKMNSSVILLKTLKTNDCFGELSFFSDQERSTCARSTDFTSAYLIKKEDFLKILKKYDNDHQRFCQIKDSINLYHNYQDLYINCYACQKNFHLVKDCPNLNYESIKDVVLQQHLFCPNQTRSNQFKRKREKFKSKILKNVIKTNILDFQTTLCPINASSISHRDDDSEEMPAISLSSDRNYEEPSYFNEESLRMITLDNLFKNKLDEASNSSKKITRSITEKSTKNNKKKYLAPSNKLINQKVWSDHSLFRNNSSSNRKQPNCLKIKHNELQSRKIASQASLNNNNLNLPKFIGKLQETLIKKEADKKNTKDFDAINIDNVQNLFCYFPHNNCKNVIESINIFNDDRIKKKITIQANNQIILL